MGIDKKYRDELFNQLAKSPALKREKDLLNSLAQQPLFWIAASKNAKETYPLYGYALCPWAKGEKKEECIKCLTRTIQRVKKTGKIEEFVCLSHFFGLCIPLLHGDVFYGFLILCHLKNRLSKDVLALLTALNTEILEKAQKELELSKLYQTIRPRAIALSTIHTVHRLISTSLDLEELLPRIARLSLQILRAKKCVISLVEKKTDQLVPKAVIDVTQQKKRIRISPYVKMIQDKVKSTGNILFKKSFLSVPLIDEGLLGVITVLKKINKKPFDNFDQEILSALSEQAVGAIKNAQLYKEQEDMLWGTVKSLSALLRIKSAYPYTHEKVFRSIVVGIGKELKLSGEDMRDLSFAAMLHDAEKIGIPEQILKKPTSLSGKELKIVKERPKKNIRILKPLEGLKPALNIILHHHEKFDGTGYPGKLKGEEIPLGSRIIAVADSFEAMVSHRPYRKSTSVNEAIIEIKNNSGTQFDPEVIKAFLQFTERNSFKRWFKNAGYC
ncbi:MAG: HD domain-containing phosphohydrolase [Candidatus Omnitrophota bacterium]